MKSIKLMHLADYHIGYEYKFLKDKSEKRKLEVLNSLEALCDLANGKCVDLVLIAGDFIEASSISSAYIYEIKNTLSKFKAQVFIVAGNHDYISLASYYLDEDWPSNTHIFKTDQVERVYIEDLNTCVYGASFVSSYQRQGQLDHDFNLNKDLINIGIFHGDAIFQTDDLYNPISRMEIANSGFDYLALGHIHKKSGLLKEGKTLFSYPGSPVSLGFFEQGPRGVLLLDLDKTSLKDDFYELEIGQFIEEKVDISDLNFERELSERILSLLEKKYKNFEKNYYRIILTGYVDENFAASFDKHLLEDLLKGLTYVEILDETRLDLDFDLVKKENSLKGKFIYNIMKEKEEAKKCGDDQRLEILDKALNACLKAFEGKI